MLGISIEAKALLFFSSELCRGFNLTSMHRNLIPPVMRELNFWNLIDWKFHLSLQLPIMNLRVASPVVDLIPEGFDLPMTHWVPMCHVLGNSISRATQPLKSAALYTHCRLSTGSMSYSGRSGSSHFLHSRTNSRCYV